MRYAPYPAATVLESLAVLKKSICKPHGYSVF